MSFYGTGSIGFEPFASPSGGYMPAQSPYPSYPAGPPPVQQPYPGYAGYPPAPQPSYASFQPPPPSLEYRPSVTPVYPPSVNAYSAPSSNVPFSGYPTASYPLPTASSTLPYPAQPVQPGFGFPSASCAVPQPPAIGCTAATSYPAGHPPPGGNWAGGAHGMHPVSNPVFLGEGTVKPFAAFNAEEDSKALRKAMKGLGTDEQTIINILGRRSNQQRLQLKLTFKTLFGRDLVNDLSSELSFRFKQTILALMMSPAEFDASELNRAIKGLGTNEATLVEILCTRNNAQIAGIKAEYRNKYHRELERDLIGDTSGHFRRFVVSLVTANRREDGYVDLERARREATELFQAGEARWGTDESKFNQILCSQSFAQLRATFDEYQRIAHRSIQQSLIREMSGDLLMGMSTIVQVVMNPHRYFAERLYHAMKGAGTDDDTLIRIIVSRCEVDLVQIKQEFHRQYGQSLEAFVQDDTSGDYRKILLTLIRGF